MENFHKIKIKKRPKNQVPKMMLFVNNSINNSYLTGDMTSIAIANQTQTQNNITSSLT